MPLAGKERALELASGNMKDNETVVLAAVGKNVRVLRFASENMKNNVTVVLAAVGVLKMQPCPSIVTCVRSLQGDMKNGRAESKMQPCPSMVQCVRSLECDMKKSRSQGGGDN